MTIYDTYFSHDWNTREGQKEGKLQCSHFTTLRHFNGKYNAGTVHRIWNNDTNKSGKKQFDYAVSLGQYPFKFEDIEKFDLLCRLDTGLGWNETKHLMSKMYKDIQPHTVLSFTLFRYLTKAEIQSLTDKLKTDSEPTLIS